MITRTLLTAGALGLLLAVAGCDRREQSNTTNTTTTTTTTTTTNTSATNTSDLQADAQNLAADVKEKAKNAGGDLKAITKDPEVRKAAEELKGSLKDLGTAVKDASKDTKRDSGPSATNATR